MPTTLRLAGSLFGSLNVDEVAKVTEKNQSNPKNSELDLNHCRHNKSSFKVKSQWSFLEGENH